MAKRMTAEERVQCLFRPMGDEGPLIMPLKSRVVATLEAHAAQETAVLRDQLRRAEERELEALRERDALRAGVA